MPRSLLPIFLGTMLIVASACSKGSDTIAADTCAHTRAAIEQFSLCIPEGWDPQVQAFGNEGSVVVYLRPSESEEAAMQIHVKKDVLETPVESSVAFSERAVSLSRQQAPGYEAVRTDPMTTSDGKKTVLHVFDAQLNENDDPVRYYQYVTTVGDIAYGFTAVLLPGVSEEQIETLLDIFTSVRFT